MGSYHPLFQLKVQHLFFREASGLRLDFVPTPYSQDLLQRAGLLTRASENGLNVFYDAEKTEALEYYLSDSDAPFSFQYRVSSKDPRFRNYTKAPAYKDDALLYFNNQNVNASARDAFLLHASQYVSEADFKSFDSPELKDVLSKKDHLLRPAFVVELKLSESVLREGAKQYVIQFDARATTWKYYFLGHLAEKEPCISDLSNKTEFEFGGTTVLPGHKTALIFRSKTTIPLRENFQSRFQLKEKREQNGKVIIKRLPFASAHQISTETIDGKESVISEIYVNC